MKPKNQFPKEATELVQGFLTCAVIVLILLGLFAVAGYFLAHLVSMFYPPISSLEF